MRETNWQRSEKRTGGGVGSKLREGKLNCARSGKPELKRGRSEKRKNCTTGPLYTSALHCLHRTRVHGLINAWACECRYVIRPNLVDFATTIFDQCWFI